MRYVLLCHILLFSGGLTYAQSPADIDQRYHNIVKMLDNGKNAIEIGKSLDTLLVYAKAINYYGGISDGLCIKGHLLVDESEYTSAAYEYLESTNAARQEGDSSRVARGLINLCNIYAIQEQYTEAIEFGLLAEKLLEQAIAIGKADERALDKNQMRLSELKLNLSVAYGHFNDQRKALGYAYSAVQGHKNRNSPDPLLVAGAYLNLGDWYATFSKPENHFLDSAYYYYKQSLQIFLEVKNACSIPQVYINMAAVTMDMKHKKDAWALLQKAEYANSSCQNSDIVAALDWDIQFQKAQWLLFEKNATAALPIFKTVFRLNPDLFLQSDGSKFLAQAFEMVGLADSAAFYYKMALTRSDTTFEKEQIDFNTTTLHRFEERKNRQIEVEALKAKAAESHGYMLWLVLMGAILMLLLIGTLYLLQRNRSKIKDKEYQLQVSDLLSKNEMVFLDGQNEGKSARIDQIYSALHSEYVPDLSIIKRGLEGLNKKMALGLAPYELGSDLYIQLTDVTAKIRTLAQELSPENKAVQHSVSGDLLESIEQRVQIINRQRRTMVSLHRTDILVSERFALDLRRIVIDLLENALKYAHAKHIEIKMLQTKEMLEIAVKDDGIGMPSESLDMGTGLKAITSKVAKYNGIGPVIESSSEFGTTVSIQFPMNSF
jgi:two-component system, NarL family, sensor histidine kinase LiaS